MAVPAKIQPERRQPPIRARQIWNATLAASIFSVPAALMFGFAAAKESDIWTGIGAGVLAAVLVTGGLFVLWFWPNQPPSPTTHPQFLGALEIWIRKQSEILVLFRYSHAGGMREFEFFTSYPALVDKLRKLPPLTSVIVFKQPQLPLRGIVDDAFISKCLDGIPDGSEYLIVGRVPRESGSGLCFDHKDGQSHTELREHLEEARGVLVSAGLYPPWLQDSDDVISAVVPAEPFDTRSGVY